MFSTVREIPETGVNGLATETVAMPGIGPTDSRLVLGNRQLAAIGFVIVVLMGLIATLAYIAGRVVTPAEVVKATAAEISKRQPEQLIVVDAARIPAPAQAPAPGKPSPMPAAAASNPLLAPRPAQVPPVEGPPVPNPASGELYWQVASVDRGMGEVSVEYLIKKGIPARLAPGIGPAVFRVLVGPVPPEDDGGKRKSELEALGFTPFLKKY